MRQHAVSRCQEDLTVRSRTAKLLPTDEERVGEFARLCSLVIDEARSLLEPLSYQTSYERVATEHQVLDLVRLDTPAAKEVREEG
jgi:hypothetical protein